MSIVFCYQAKAPTSSGLRAPTMSGPSTNMEQICNTHVNGCQAEAPTSQRCQAKAPTWNRYSMHMSMVVRLRLQHRQAQGLQRCQAKAPTWNRYSMHTNGFLISRARLSSHSVQNLQHEKQAGASCGRAFNSTQMNEWLYELTSLLWRSPYWDSSMHTP